MKSEQVFKHIKLVLLGIMVAFLAQIFFTAEAQAQEVGGGPRVELTVAERVDALYETLALVGAAIAQSTTITDEERVELLGQLVDLSRAIVALQRNAALEAAEISLDALNGGDVARLDPLDIDLHRVSVQLDLDTRQAMVTEYYLDEDDDLEQDLLEVEYDRIEWVQTLDAPAGALSFDGFVEFYEGQIIAELMDRYGLTEDIAVDRITHVSARNPRRDEVRAISLNSSEAYSIAGDFGTRSLITDVRVYSNNGQSQIEIESDQEERMLITITRANYGYDRELDGDIEPPDDEYQYVYEFYVTTLGDLFNNNDSDEVDTGLEPVVSQILNDLTETELLASINDLFGEIPFTSRLIDADETLLAFLLNNRSRYESRTTYVPSEVPECINDGDRLVVDEYVLQLLSGMRVNYILDELQITYPTQLIVNEEMNGEGRCRQENHYF